MQPTAPARRAPRLMPDVSLLTTALNACDVITMGSFIVIVRTA